MKTNPLNLFFVFASFAAQCAHADSPPIETAEQRASRMKWFAEARFGMFIHWGVYSVPAGEYGGRTDHAEWIMETGKIPVSKYEKFADEFNPEKFDAREWAKLAKEAGMKYLVITSKHHDGFGLWPSKLGDWNIGRTPFKRDPLKELSEACRAEGIKFCLYHSIMDWHHPDYEVRRSWNDLATGKPDMDRYQNYMEGQLKELLTNYGPLGILWFDGEWERAWNNERGLHTYNLVRSIQPDLIVNNRVGHGRAGMSGMNKGEGVGDYGTPEQEIPPTGFGAGVYWESCMTMNDHWGYNKNDQHWKSTQQLVHNLIDCSSKGGNFLLNVGPTAEGLIPTPSIERLRELGQWTKANGEAIYGTQAGPFRKLPWGRATQKSDGKQTTLYLHVFNWPSDGKLIVPGLLNKPESASLLVGGKKLSAKETESGVEIEVPAEAPDKISSTLVLKLADKPEVAEGRIAQSKDGSLLLEAADADLVGHQIRTEAIDGKTNIGYWTDSGDRAEWQIKVTRGGSFEVTVETAAESSGKFVIEVGGEKLAGSAAETQSYHKFVTTKLGSLKLTPGNHTLAVRPSAESWHPMNLRSVKLEPTI